MVNRMPYDLDGLLNKEQSIIFASSEGKKLRNS